MREIEIKARLHDPKLVWEELDRLGIKPSGTIFQRDLIFVAKPYRLRDIDATVSPVVRIREEQSGCTLTAKKNRTDQLDSIEHEVSVDDRDAAAAILDALGYHQVLEIVKRRQKFKLQDFSVCVDDVDRLGTFIEVEALVAEEAQIDDIRQAMWQLLRPFSVNPKDQVTKGYDRLLDEI
jgi:adenylate cyclase, class 2